MAAGPFIVFCLNLLSAAVAFLTSYNAYKFRRVAENPLMTSLALGFMLLGVGLMVEAGATVALGQTIADRLVSGLLAVLGTFTYLSIQMLAYLVFAVGYALFAFGRQTQVAAAAAVALAVPRVIDVAGLYRYAVVSYFVAFVLLAFVVFEGALIHSRSRTTFSLLVLLGFVLILAAHVVLLVSVVALSGWLFFLGTSIQFLGFVSLLVFVLRSGRVGSG